MGTRVALKLAKFAMGGFEPKYIYIHVGSHFARSSLGYLADETGGVRIVPGAVFISVF